MTKILSIVTICVLLATQAIARPPLREQAEIDDGLMAIAIADDIRKRCDGLSARMGVALTRMHALRSQARDKGYTSKEIDTYVTSSSEKARMRSKAETWLDGQGVDLANDAQMCAFGHAEIKRRSPVGRLLRGH